MLSRACTQAARNSSISGVIDLVGHQVGRQERPTPKRRIDTRAPSSASGGMMALTRLPSGSRQSTIGLVSSTRRPAWPHDPLDDVQQMPVVVKATSVRSSRPWRSTYTVWGR